MAPTQPVAVSRVVRKFEGEPLIVNFDGGFAKGYGATGFTV